MFSRWMTHSPSRGLFFLGHRGQTLEVITSSSPEPKQHVDARASSYPSRFVLMEIISVTLQQSQRCQGGSLPSVMYQGKPHWWCCFTVMKSRHHIMKSASNSGWWSSPSLLSTVTIPLRSCSVSFQSPFPVPTANQPARSFSCDAFDLVFSFF